MEPVVVRNGEADFGTVNGQQSIAELQDLITLWAYRMQQLDQWYGTASPIWVTKDLAAYSDFTNDRLNLENRYNAALSDAQSAITIAKINVFAPNSMLPAQSQYDELMKAMLQCYPPDGCASQKGDWQDLYNRAVAVSPSLSIAAPGDAPPQPAASDVDLNVFASTAKADLVAQITGAQKAGPLSLGLATSIQNFIAWIAAHKTAVLIGGAVVLGGVVIAYVGMLAAVPMKIAKVATAVL